MKTSWTGEHFHDSKGRILGSVLAFNDRYKALVNNIFIGFYINKEYAMNAVEEAYEDFKNDSINFKP